MSPHLNNGNLKISIKILQNLSLMFLGTKIQVKKSNQCYNSNAITYVKIIGGNYVYLCKSLIHFFGKDY